MAQRWGDVGGGVDAADMKGGGGEADGLVRFRKLREGDKDAVFAEDTAFFRGDFSNGVAEVFLVVESDVGDDAEEWVDDVGSIQTATEAYFKDHDLGGGE